MPARTTFDQVAAQRAGAASDDAGDVDEELLLDETEALLSVLHPTAFLASSSSAPRSPAFAAAPTTEKPVRLTTASSSETSSSSSDSNSCERSIVPAATPFRRPRHYQTPHDQQQPLRRRGRPGPSPKPGATRNVSRERLRSELSDLREQVRRLEHDLQSKHHARRAILSLQAWERVAKSQCAKRWRVETERQELTARVARQDAFIVEMLLQWRQSTMPLAIPRPLSSVNSAVAAHQQQQQQPLHFDAGEPALLETFVAALDGVYARTDAVLQAGSLDRVDLTPFRRVTPQQEIRSDGTLRCYNETTALEVVPFAYDQYQRIAWPCMRQLQLTRGETIRYTSNSCKDDDTDTIAVKQRMTFERNGAPTEVSLVFAMRRYSAKDHEVWVWRGIAKGGRDLAHLGIDEVGWVVTSDLAAAFGDSDDDDDGGAVASAVASAAAAAGVALRVCIQYELLVLLPQQRVAASDVADELTPTIIDVNDELSTDLIAMLESMALDVARQASSNEASSNEASSNEASSSS